MASSQQTSAVVPVADGDRQTCPECDAGLATDGCELVCDECGLVVEEDLIDHGPDWRAFTEQQREERVRTGSARSERLHDHGMTTKIGYGRGTIEHGDARISRLRTWQKRASADHHDRNLSRILSEVRRIATELELGDSIVDRACRIGREAHSDGEAVGVSLEAVAAASVLAAAREEGVPVVGDMVLQLTDVDRRRLFRKYHDVCETCGVAVRPMEPVEHVPSIASAVGLTDKVRILAEEIAAEAADRGLHSGRKPEGIAAACIYVAATEDHYEISQPTLAEASSVCAVTVRNARDHLAEAGLFDEVDS